MKLETLTGRFAGLLLLAGCSTPAPMGEDSMPSARRLGAADFEVVADAASVAPVALYYKTYRFDARTSVYVAERGGQLQGFLTHRDRAGYRLLPDGSYDDGQFNRVELVPLEDRKQRPVIMSISAAPDGTTVFGLEDADSSPRLRLVITFRDHSFLGVLSEREMLSELPCMDASARRGSITDLLRCIGLTGSGGDGGGAGGGSALPGSGGLLGEPDCKDNPLGPATQQSPNPAEVQRRIDQVRDDMNKAIAERDRQTSDSARQAYQDYINQLAGELRHLRALQDAREALKELRDPSREPPANKKEIHHAEDRIQMEEGLVERYHERVKASLRELNRQRQSGGGAHSPSLVDAGEAAPVADPRCQGRKVDAARGTLFTNRDFCGDDDPLTCLRRQEDSIYGLTEGQCWTETGPDDRPTLVCKERERQHPGEGPASGSDEPPRCEATDVDCFTDPVAPRFSNRRIATRYFDLTPMADVIAALCASGGCPDPAERP
jgi:hypothetical protein